MSSDHAADNASHAEVHRWFVGDNPEPEYEVSWEQQWNYEGDEDERSATFDSLDKALEKIRALLTVKESDVFGDVDEDEEEAQKE